MAASRIEFSAHAVRQCRRRGLDKALVLKVVQSPQQRVPAGTGRVILQRRYRRSPGEPIGLLRVVVEDLGDRTVIITAYRTSKVAKYWKRD